MSLCSAFFSSRNLPTYKQFGCFSSVQHIQQSTRPTSLNMRCICAGTSNIFRRAILHRATEALTSLAS